MMAVCTVPACENPGASHLDLHIVGGNVMRLLRCADHTPSEDQVLEMARGLDMVVHVHPVVPLCRDLPRDLQRNLIVAGRARRRRSGWGL